jgi:hypothetical protein
VCTHTRATEDAARRRFAARGPITTFEIDAQ